VVAKSLIAKNQNLKNLDVRTYKIFLMHHVNVLKRLQQRDNRIKHGDESMWLGCNIANELKVLEDEIVDLILLAD
jgi:hypothetical protein